jgi:uncharacterized membrane protein
VIVVRHSVVVDEPVARVGHLWADFVAHRITQPDFLPDEWLEMDDARGVMGAGDVHFESLSVARTRVTLSLGLDLQPSDPATGPEVEGAYHRAVAHLDRFHAYVDERTA